jgi:hypothetical protein
MSFSNKHTGSKDRFSGSNQSFDLARILLQRNLLFALYQITGKQGRSFDEIFSSSRRAE